MNRCIYCDFVSGIYSPEKETAYVKALKKEIDRLPENCSFDTLYIGGGTPTALSTPSLEELIGHMFRSLHFTKDCEATIEANPGTVDNEKLLALRSSGINRISMGVQSFNDTELAFLGRIHTPEQAVEAMNMAKAAGFINVGIDLMYGIPGQDIISWNTTLEKAVSAGPQHVSTYELTVEEGTTLSHLMYANNLRRIIPPHPPLKKGGTLAIPLWQRGERPVLLDEEKIIEMYHYAIDHLTSQGFRHYEISNFCRPDFQCRHNMNYWDRGGYFGVGLGAHSFLNDERLHNTDKLDVYLNSLSEQRSPVKSSERVTGDRAVSEAIFLGLRKTDGINIESFLRCYHINLLTVFHNEIEELKKAGLIELLSSPSSSASHLRLTRGGMLLSNEVFTKFM